MAFSPYPANWPWVRLNAQYIKTACNKQAVKKQNNYDRFLATRCSIVLPYSGERVLTVLTHGV